MEKAECETTITYDMEERVVRIFSAIKRDQTRLNKAGIKPYLGRPERGYFYKVPMSRLRWRVTSGVPSKRGFGSQNPKNLHSTASIPGRIGKVV